LIAVALRWTLVAVLSLAITLVMSVSSTILSSATVGWVDLVVGYTCVLLLVRGAIEAASQP